MTLQTYNTLSAVIQYVPTDVMMTLIATADVDKAESSFLQVLTMMQSLINQE